MSARLAIRSTRRPLSRCRTSTRSSRHRITGGSNRDSIRVDCSALALLNNSASSTKEKPGYTGLFLLSDKPKVRAALVYALGDNAESVVGVPHDEVQGCRAGTAASSCSGKQNSEYLATLKEFGPFNFEFGQRNSMWDTTNFEFGMTNSEFGSRNSKLIKPVS